MNEVATDIRRKKLGDVCIGQMFWCNPFCHGSPINAEGLRGLLANNDKSISIIVHDSFAGKSHKLGIDSPVYVRGSQ